MVAVREREVRLEKRAKAAETHLRHNKSMAAQMLKLSESNLSVARLLKMRKE